MEATADSASKGARDALVRWGKPALLALGACAIAYVVASTGPRHVLDALIHAAPWMPGIVLLDAFYFVGESMAHRALMGEQANAIPRNVFVRTVLSSYAFAVLAPLGRASVEVTRVAGYAEWVGAGRATAASALVQAVSTFANALLCLAAATASAHALGLRHPLTLTLFALTAGMLLLAGATALLMRRSRVGAWVGARIPKLREAGADLDQALRDSPSSLARAALWCSASRVSQVGQAALLILAVGGAVTPVTALISQGIHIVGSTFGEAIPGQTGVIEASYRVFADGLGFGADPARAVAIALLCRMSQIIVASTSLLLLALVPGLRDGKDARPSRLREAAVPVLIVLVALAVNLGKPVHIDDAAHIAIARWIREHPTHPMSGVVYWGEHPTPIHMLNQPPGLFFLIAGLMALFGDDALVAQHLMIAAFVVLGVVAYLDLAKRLVPPAWVMLTAVALFLSPAFLPSQNLMTDVPLLALWLAFFALLDRAGDEGTAGVRAHVFAALAASAACFVKYTSLVLFAVLAVDLVLHYRRRLAVMLVPIAALAAWSAWNVADYGGVHVLGRPVEVGHSPSVLAAIGIILGRAGLWVITLGAVAPFVLAFAPKPATLRRPGFWIGAVAMLVVSTAIGQALAALVPDYLGGESMLHSALRGLFLGIGILALIRPVAMGVAAFRGPVARLFAPLGPDVETRRTRLLVAWLAIAFVFIVVLSPFISVRHVLLAMPAVLLLLVRAAPEGPSARAQVVVWGAVPLALAVATADAEYAAVYRDYAAEVAAEGTSGTTWTVGHWGWQYYAERAGMREYDPGISVLRPGDRLIRPRLVDQQSIAPADRKRLERVGERVVWGSGPLATMRTVTDRQGFYAVWGGLPFTFTRAPLEVFEIFRVKDGADAVSTAKGSR